MISFFEFEIKTGLFFGAFKQALPPTHEKIVKKIRLLFYYAIKQTLKGLQPETTDRLQDTRIMPLIQTHLNGRYQSSTSSPCIEQYVLANSNTRLT